MPASLSSTYRPRATVLDRKGKPVQIVEASTSLMDVLPLSEPGSANATLAGRRRGSGIELRWSDKVPRLIPQNEIADAKTALIHLIHQTMSALPNAATDPEVMRTVDRQLRLIQDQRSLRPENTASLVRPAFEALIKAEMSRLGNQVSEASTPRVPVDCTIEMMDALDRVAVQSLPPPVAQRVANLREKVRRHWLAHDMTVHSTRELFRSLASECRRTKASALEPIASLAGRLADELPQHADGIPWLRLNDNIYGRVWESALAQAMLANMPQAVLTAASTFGRELLQLLVRSNLGVVGTVCNLTAKLVKKDPRFWWPKVPQMQALQNADGSEAGRVILNILRSPAEHGLDCLAKFRVMIDFIITMGGFIGDHLPWLAEANTNYLNAIVPAANRREASASPQEGGGVTKAYQPPVILDGEMMPSRRMSTVYSPDGGFSQETIISLTHGIPWTSGASGTTNVFAYAIDWLVGRYGANIDPAPALLGAIMSLTYDGGHSVHEALWVLNQTADKLNLGFARQSEPAQFVSDYALYFDSFLDAETKRCLSNAQQHAWDATLAYRRIHTLQSTDPGRQVQ